MLIFLFFTFAVIASAVPGGNISNEDNCPTYCEGIAYNCVKGKCFCANGFIPNYYQTQCVKCPGLEEACYGLCCGDNITLHCWNGICQSCYGTQGNWICRESVDQILVSGTQIVMAAALVLGIIATFVLLYKLCAATSISPQGRSATDGGRLSVGSLQIYVDERLRDAPPRYTRIAPSGSSIYPATIYLNSGFIHDNSLPPPPYTPPEIKEENSPNVIGHI